MECDLKAQTLILFSSEMTVTKAKMNNGISFRCYQSIRDAELLTYLNTEAVFKLNIGHLEISKGKAVPFQAWSGPERSRKLRFPDFMTTVQDGGKFVSLMHRPTLPPRKYTWY
jgi:hypothetical protein